jgi:hypothetical protein
MIGFATLNPDGAAGPTLPSKKMGSVRLPADPLP